MHFAPHLPANIYLKEVGRWVEASILWGGYGIPERVIHYWNSTPYTSCAPTTMLNMSEQSLWNLMHIILQLCPHRDLSLPNPVPQSQQDCSGSPRTCLGAPRQELTTSCIRFEITVPSSIWFAHTHLLILNQQRNSGVWVQWQGCLRSST